MKDKMLFSPLDEGLEVIAGATDFRELDKIKKYEKEVKRDKDYKLKFRI